QLQRFNTEIHLISIHPGELEGCSIHLVKSPFPFGLLNYLSALPAIRKKIREIDPDVVDVHGISSYGAYGLFPLKAYPYMATIYGPDLSMHARRYRVLAAMANQCFKHAHSIFSSTPTTQELIHEICGATYPDTFIAHSWGIHAEDILANREERRRVIREEFDVPEGTRVILHNRQFTDFWHIEEILTATRNLLAERSDLVLWFVYPIPNPKTAAYIQSKEEEIRAAGLENQIVLHGPQEYERMISFMHASDIYLCMGRSDQLSTSVLEALCCGLIPVLHDIPSYHEVVEHQNNGYLLPRITVEAVEEQLRYVLEHFDEEYARMADQNRKRMIDDYDETPCVTWFMDRYEEIKQAKDAAAQR
ncbi:MAG: glycosyltransferase involved in cell wall biosynthesis, partial [Candidatus Omnitrophota bacterium]